MSFTVTHLKLYQLLMEKSSEPWNYRYEHVDNVIKRAFPQDISDDDWKAVKVDCRKKYAAIKKRWDDSSRIEAKFCKKNVAWLETPVTFAILDKQTAKTSDTVPGRPETEFSTSSERSKRRKVQELRERVPPEVLAYATQMSLRSAGKLEQSKLLKSVGPKLVPFFKTVAIYFVLFIPVERPSWFAMIIKCLPIVSLIVFVLLHGMSLGDEYTFSRRILTGLVFSCLGDALLVWPQYFLHGMTAFGMAQLMYTAAFGFKPLNAALGVVLYSLCATATVVLMPGLSGVLAAGVPIYSILLITMAWRAIARVQLFEELWTWTKLCSCAGGIIFAVSDGLIGFHHFHHPIPHSQALIMVTYYAAQLGIALSVVDSKASYNKLQLVSSKTNGISLPTGNKMRRAIRLHSTH